MSNFANQQQRNAEQRESNKSARETMGKYFYDLSKTSFAVMVLGSFTTILGIDSPNWFLTITFVICGIVSTYTFAYLGNKTLKK